MDGRQLIIMGLSALILTGCVSQLTDKSAQLPDETGAQSSPYEVFVQEIQSNNLAEYGIDIVSMLNEHFRAPDELTQIKYSLEKCNLSKKDAPSPDDMIVRIDAGKQGPDNTSSYYTTVIFVFVLNDNGQLDTVFNEDVASGARYEVMDVTGDGRDEIILKKTVGRQTGVQELINILTWRPEQNKMWLIFDERLFYYPVHPYSCRNSYQLVPVRSGGYDIILRSMIYYREDDIFEAGYTRFAFNGNNYEVSGKYYDYQARGEVIGTDMQRVGPGSN